MAVTAEDIVKIMKEVGVDTEIIRKLKNDVPLLAQGLDSIDLPAIAAATEKRYNIDLSDADATILKTINDFVAFVNAKMK
jgi:acyl carrier protein